jgi:hypothetical protein
MRRLGWLLAVWALWCNPPGMLLPLQPMPECRASGNRTDNQGFDELQVKVTKMKRLKTKALIEMSFKLIFPLPDRSKY